jgi:hypothetical protein
MSNFSDYDHEKLDVQIVIRRMAEAKEIILILT